MASSEPGFLGRMGGRVARLFRGKAAPHPGNLERDRHYVSDYERFIGEFLEEHPEELLEQRKGWNIWWDKAIDLDQQARGQAATVPEDGYGFFASAWCRPGREGPPQPH